MAQPARSRPPDDRTADPEVLETLRRANRRPGRWIALGVGVFALVALITWWVWPTGEQDGGWQQETVTRGPLVMTVTAVGKLEPVDSVEIGSDLSGRLETVAVRTNDPVTAAEELARLDPEPFENVVAQARAQVASARAALTQARVNLESGKRDQGRAARLLEDGAVTQVEADNADLAVEVGEANVSAARAQLAQATATLERAEDDLRDSVITSPIDGVVTQRYVDPGQTVVSAMQATPLFEIASDLGQMKAEVGIDEADIGVVSEGLPATFTVSAWPNRVFEATVASVDIAPDPTQAVVTYDAELRISNDDLALRPGMTATADIEIGRLDDVLQVPGAALRFTPKNAEPGKGPTVWRLVDKAPQPIAVTVLGSDGARSAIAGEGVTDDLVVLVGGEVR